MKLARRTNSEECGVACYSAVNVIDLSHMRRGGVYPLPQNGEPYREGITPSPTESHLKLMALTPQ